MSQPGKTNDIDLYTFASNGTSALESFKERLEYKQSIIFSAELNHEYSFWGREQFYGRVNQKGEAIYVNESQLKSLRHSNSSVTTFAINFVADAWGDFIDRVTDEANAGILYKDGPYYEMKAKKTWRSATSAYHLHLLERMYPAFIGRYLPRRLKEGERVTGVKDFFRLLDGFSTFSAKNGAPMTFTSYLTSGYCSILNTGLAIEISEEDHDQDFRKIRNFLYDANFNRIKQIASEYGFIIDPNAPWRFVADLGSQPMIEYMIGVPLGQVVLDPQNTDSFCEDPIENEPAQPDAYGFSRIPGLEGVVRHARGYGQYSGLALNSNSQEVYQRVFSRAYRKTWRDDMSYLETYMLNFYNAYIEKKPQVSIPTVLTPSQIRAGCTIPQPQIIRLAPVTYQQLKYFYGDKWALLSYYKLRSSEMSLKRAQSQQKIDVRRILDIYYKGQGNRFEKYFQALSFMHNQILLPEIQKSLTSRK